MEVKRYGLSGFGGGMIELDDGGFVDSEDFDRIHAERDALQSRLNAAEEDNDKLKSRSSFTRIVIQDYEEKISAIREMLPKCVNCEGCGEVCDGHSCFDCWVCSGTGASSENKS